MVVQTLDIGANATIPLSAQDVDNCDALRLQRTPFCGRIAGMIAGLLKRTVSEDTVWYVI